RIASNQLLAMGLSGSYVNKRTSLERLSTGSQWIQEEFRYDPNANLGEAFVQRRVKYFSLGTGIFWSVSHDDQERFFVSASAFHLNTPGESFFGEYSEVPMTYLLSSGITLVRSRRFEVEPQLYITRSNKKNEYQLV
ncbi:MAG: type IX secretion system membrane protein PorP/SprF, partial [Pseudomonadales bacterium]